MLWLDTATESCEGEPWARSCNGSVSLVVWTAGDARRRYAVRVGLLFARGCRHRHQLAVAAAAWATTNAITTACSQRGTQDPSDRQSLAPHPPQATPRPWWYGVGLRHRRLPTKRYGPHVEAAGKHHNLDPRAGRVQVPLRPRLASAPALWVRTPASWGRSPCRSSRNCISEPRMSAGWRLQTTGGKATRSWNWPPPRSSGLVEQSGQSPARWVVTDGAYAKRPSGCWLRA